MKFHFMQGRSSSAWHVLGGRGGEKNIGAVSLVIRELGIANCKKGGGGDPNPGENGGLGGASKSLGSNG
jgi:hypothetical protein